MFTFILVFSVVWCIWFFPLINALFCIFLKIFFFQVLSGRLFNSQFRKFVYFLCSPVKLANMFLQVPSGWDVKQGYVLSSGQYFNYPYSFTCYGSLAAWSPDWSLKTVTANSIISVGDEIITWREIFPEARFH